MKVESAWSSGRSSSREREREWSESNEKRDADTRAFSIDLPDTETLKSLSNKGVEEFRENKLKAEGKTRLKATLVAKDSRACTVKYRWEQACIIVSTSIRSCCHYCACWCCWDACWC